MIPIVFLGLFLPCFCLLHSPLFPVDLRVPLSPLFPPLSTLVSNRYLQLHHFLDTNYWPNFGFKIKQYVAGEMHGWYTKKNLCDIKEQQFAIFMAAGCIIKYSLYMAHTIQLPSHPPTYSGQNMWTYQREIWIFRFDHRGHKYDLHIQVILVLRICYPEVLPCILQNCGWDQTDNELFHAGRDQEIQWKQKNQNKLGLSFAQLSFSFGREGQLR